MHPASREQLRQLIKLHGVAAVQRTVEELTRVTALDLEPFIGRKWAICRNTPDNRERFGRCLTRKEYEQAEAAALAVKLEKVT
jgi:hypothetical protein